MGYFKAALPLQPTHRNNYSYFTLKSKYTPQCRNDLKFTFVVGNNIMNNNELFKHFLLLKNISLHVNYLAMLIGLFYCLYLTK